MTSTAEMGTTAPETTDSYQKNVDRFIEPATLRALSKMRPWRSSAQIVLEWIGIAGAIYLCSRYFDPWLYILTVMWIGARQNALLVLMHEGVHYRLFQNKKLNDWVGEVCTAWPVLVTLYGFRQTHWAHHRHVNQPEDPDWQRKQNEMFTFPKSGWEMLWITLKCWSGIYALIAIPQLNVVTTVPPKIKYFRLAFYLAVLTASIVFHFWQGLLLFWIVPLFTYFFWVLYVRGVAEHFGGIEHHADLLQQTRHIEANLFERLFLAPNYIHVHIGHHLYPSVPFYNLGKLQETLMQNPDYASRAHVTHGYLGFLRELLNAGLAHGDEAPHTFDAF